MNEIFAPYFLNFWQIFTSWLSSCSWFGLTFEWQIRAQSPCNDGEGGNSFCGKMVELLIYHSIEKERESGSWGLKKYLWTSVEKKKKTQKNPQNFFSLSRWKERKEKIKEKKKKKGLLLWAYYSGKLVVCYVVHTVFDV